MKPAGKEGPWPPGRHVKQAGDANATEGSPRQNDGLECVQQHDKNADDSRGKGKPMHRTSFRRNESWGWKFAPILSIVLSARLDRHLLAVLIDEAQPSDRGSSLMPEPSECIDRAESPSWLLLVLEIGKDLAIGGPLAQDTLNCVELHLRVSTFTKPVAAERSGHDIRRV